MGLAKVTGFNISANFIVTHIENYLTKIHN
ncbi:MAG: hypothetical protein IKQ70_10315 [Bacteroidales bacterium]|nr:hypothetical protein [Bacteroidales bacterium]MBR2578537.1 hypothetical protein [Clostridia bacterium]MBR6178258.1 hypothetical protein [Bacteroidales bacterium]